MQVHSPIYCGLFRIRREEGEEAAEKQQNSIYNDSWWNYGKLLRHSHQIILGDVLVPSMYTNVCQIHPFHPFIMKKTWIEVEDEVEVARLLTIFFLSNSKLAFINRAPNMKLVVSRPNSRTSTASFLEVFQNLFVRGYSNKKSRRKRCTTQHP